MTPTTYNEFYRTLGKGDSCEDFIESLQIAIVRAGGCFKSRDELMVTSVVDLQEILTRNNIAAVYMGNPPPSFKNPPQVKYDEHSWVPYKDEDDVPPDTSNNTGVIEDDPPF